MKLNQILTEKEKVLTSIYAERILREVKKWVHDQHDYDDLSMAAQELLYDAFYQQMPYGTAKARDGDPSQWLQDEADKDSNSFVDWFIQFLKDAVATNYIVYDG